MTRPVLYVVVCGAPLASRALDGIREASGRGWSPILIPTEAARPWLDPSELAEVTVVDGQRLPNEPKAAPAPDAVVVAPTTFNTLTGWANGRANTYPLSTLCAALGGGVPTVAVPFAKHDLAGHPAWLASLAVLRYAGVTLVDPSTGARNAIEPVASGTGDQVAEDFRWSWVLDCLED